MQMEFRPFSTIFVNFRQTGISKKYKIDLKQHIIKADIYAIGIFDHFRQFSSSWHLKHKKTH